VAVIIPVFNGQEDFAATMASLNHSTEPQDIIVVDDGSDPPLNVGEFDVHLIRFSHNMGIVAALNTALEFTLARGYAYIARIDVGDFAHPDRLLKQVRYLDQHPACMMVGCDTDFFTADGRYQFTIAPPRSQKSLASGLRERSWLLHSTIMFRASVFESVGLYTSEFEAAEDHEICLRIAEKHPISVVPERLATVVSSPNGISIRKRRTQLMSRMRIQLRYFRWTCLKSWTGLFKTLVSISLPLSLARWVKRTFIYDRVNEPANPLWIDSPGVGE
jgi:glycosyltransferase involved in cell wall biosynthesis